MYVKLHIGTLHSLHTNKRERRQKMDKTTIKIILNQLKDVYDNLTEKYGEDIRKFRYTLAHTIADIRTDEIAA